METQLPDLRSPDLLDLPDQGQRPGWRAISPTSADQSLKGIHGSASGALYLVTASAILRQQPGQESTPPEVLWRAPGAACLQGVLVVDEDIYATGGCQGNGLIVSRHGNDPWVVRELPNLELGRAWAQRADDVYIASPTLGVVRLTGSVVRVERLVAAGELGRGPEALAGSSPTNLFAAGGGRVWQRTGAGVWATLLDQNSGDEYHDIWFGDATNIFVVGHNRDTGGGVILRLTDQGRPTRETLKDPVTGRLLSVFGTDVTDVYAAGEGGIVLRRESTSGWRLDRVLPTPLPAIRGLFGRQKAVIYAAGAGGLSLRTADKTWRDFTPMPTGATLRGTAALSAQEAYAVGDSGTILHLAGGGLMREPTGLPPASQPALFAVAVAADGTAFAVGQGGVVLRRDKGVWSSDRVLAMGDPASDLLTVAVDARGVPFAAGTQGTVLSRQGGSWLPLSVNWPAGLVTRPSLRSLAVLRDGTLVAAGDDATVLMRGPQETGFSLSYRDPAAGVSWTGLLSVGGVGSREFWASGSGAAQLLRLQDGRFSLQAAPISEASALWGPRSDDVYLTGRDSTIWHWSGVAWSLESAPRLEALLGLSGRGDFALAVGEQGLILQRP